MSIATMLWKRDLLSILDLGTSNVVKLLLYRHGMRPLQLDTKVERSLSDSQHQSESPHADLLKSVGRVRVAEDRGIMQVVQAAATSKRHGSFVLVSLGEQDPTVSRAGERGSRAPGTAGGASRVHVLVFRFR